MDKVLVKEVIQNVKKPVIMVEWDGMPDAKESELKYGSRVELGGTKCARERKVGGWVVRWYDTIPTIWYMRRQVGRA